MSTADISRSNRTASLTRGVWAIAILAIIVILLFFSSFFVGYSSLSFTEVMGGLFGQGSGLAVRIVQNVRLPRTLAALLIGGGLSLSGLIMQSCLRNPMASPTTLGVSNGAVLGANIAIILASGTGASFSLVAAHPYAVSGMALLFALLSIAIVLGVSSFRKFSPTTVVLVGVALSSMFTAITTLIQYFADDVQLSSVVNWSFGNLERMDMLQNGILGVVLLLVFLLFMGLSFRFNALLSGERMAKNMGVRTSLLRVVGLGFASLLAALCVCFVGIIGFVGIIAPHIVKRFLGHDHRITIPASLLAGSALLLLCDILTRAIGSGVSLPVGAVTAIIGAPFFVFLIVMKKGEEA